MTRKQWRARQENIRRSRAVRLKVLKELSRRTDELKAELAQLDEAEKHLEGLKPPPRRRAKRKRRKAKRKHRIAKPRK